MSIKLYDNEIAERVIPAQKDRPKLRYVLDQAIAVGDKLEIVAKINGVEVGVPLEYTPEDSPDAGKNIVACISLDVTDQKSANIKPVAEQVAGNFYTMTKAERIAAVEEAVVLKAPIIVK